MTSAARVAAAASRGACNAVLLKPNQAGTITETKAALDAARTAGWRTVVSARSGETEDVTIVHLAVGWNAGQLKVGSFARSERMAKWNEGLRIEAALGPAAAFAGWRTEMKAVLQYRASPGLRQRIAALDFPTVVVDETDKDTFRREMRDADILLHVLEPVTAAVIDAAPRLRLIQKIGIGVNTIDLDAARRRGIAVCNMPGTNTQAVAEMTLLLMLATLRRLAQLDRLTRAGQGWAFEPELPDDLGELSGRTVGLVGFGAVARRLVPMLQAIGANGGLHQPAARRHIVRYPFCRLSELLPVADMLSLHLPLTPETTGMIDAAAFAAMKRGSVLINTARGPLVDEAALFEALTSGHLRGAGLDVFSREPVGADDLLLKLPNVVVTPHLAWLTTETLERSLAVIAENCGRLDIGEALLHRVV